MKQFVRIYRDPASGDIAHVYTQGTPIEYDAIAIEGQTFEREDLEIDDIPDNAAAPTEGEGADGPRPPVPFISAFQVLGATSNPGKTKLAKLDATKLPPGLKVGAHAKR